VSLTIDSLALPGYSAQSGARLAGAFERELGRLLASAPLPAQGLDAPLLRIPRFRSVAHESPERTGQRLARAIHQRLPP
jgi:hypothetical protein